MANKGRNNKRGNGKQRQPAKPTGRGDQEAPTLGADYEDVRDAEVDQDQDREWEEASLQGAEIEVVATDEDESTQMGQAEKSSEGTKPRAGKRAAAKSSRGTKRGNAGSQSARGASAKRAPKARAGRSSARAGKTSKPGRKRR
jgi:hypothetical protein